MFGRVSVSARSFYGLAKSCSVSPVFVARTLQNYYIYKAHQHPQPTLYYFEKFRTLYKSLTSETDNINTREDGKQNNSTRPNAKYFLIAGVLSTLFETEDKEKLSDKEKAGEEQIVKMIKMARLSCEQGDFSKAERLLHLALRVAHDLQHTQAQTYIIDAMANVAYEAEDFKKAEKLFKETMRQLIADGALESDNAIIHISAKLAKLYGLFEDEFKATEGFKFCMKHLEQKLKEGVEDFDTLALHSLVLSWYGEYVYSRGRPEESLGLFKKSHEISLKINGPTHPHSLLQLNNMAASYSLMNQLDDAVDCLNQAIALVQENKMDDGEYDLPFYHLNLANVYLTQLENPRADTAQMLRKASEACQRAMRLARKAGVNQVLQEAEKCLATIKQQTNEYRAMLNR